MKKIFPIGLISILFISILSGCQNYQKGAEMGSKDSIQSLPKVRISKVSKRDVAQNTNFTATAEAQIKNSIAPSTPTRIRHIFVEVGDKVVKGQRLAQMDKVNLTKLQTELNNIRENYRRISELYGVGGASKQDLDNAKAQLEVATANSTSLEENTYLLSPINGIVTARNYDNGDLFNGQQALLTVMQVNPIKLKINISESYFSKVKKGLHVDVSFDVYEDEKFKGEISLIYPTIDPYTRTFTAEVKLRNDKNKIRPGMFGRVMINFGSEKRMVIPDRAVVKQPGSGVRYVYVYEEGKAYYREVALGIRLGSEYEVLSGLTEGEQIIIAGQSKLSDGDNVAVID